MDGQNSVENAVNSVMGQTNVLDSYKITIRGVPVSVEITKAPDQTVPSYNVDYPVIPFVNSAMESEIKLRLIKLFTPSMLKFTTTEEYAQIEEKFEAATFRILDELI